MVVPGTIFFWNTRMEEWKLQACRFSGCIATNDSKIPSVRWRQVWLQRVGNSSMAREGYCVSLLRPLRAWICFGDTPPWILTNIPLKLMVGRWFIFNFEKVPCNRGTNSFIFRGTPNVVDSSIVEYKSFARQPADGKFALVASLASLDFASRLYTSDFW